MCEGVRDKLGLLEGVGVPDGVMEGVRVFEGVTDAEPDAELEGDAEGEPATDDEFNAELEEVDEANRVTEGVKQTLEELQARELKDARGEAQDVKVLETHSVEDSVPLHESVEPPVCDAHNEGREELLALALGEDEGVGCDDADNDRELVTLNVPQCDAVVVAFADESAERLPAFVLLAALEPPALLDPTADKERCAVADTVAEGCSEDWEETEGTELLEGALEMLALGDPRALPVLQGVPLEFSTVDVSSGVSVNEGTPEELALGDGADEELSASLALIETDDDVLKEMACDCVTLSLIEVLEEGDTDATALALETDEPDMVAEKAPLLL